MKLVAQSGRAAAVVDPAAGGRVTSLMVDGHELLVTDPGVGPLTWGCYPMVPWAGRLNRGRFAFDGTEYAVEVDAAPHAIHGIGYKRPWLELGPGCLALDLDHGWPLGGRAEQHLAIDDRSLALTLSVRAGERAMPAVLGWHPCFRRHLGENGAPVELTFEPSGMWQRGDDGLPDGTRVPPPPGPWDDAFDGVSSAPTLRWPGALTLSLHADAPVWVVFDQRDDVVCVEPQTGLPDGLNQRPTVVAPGATVALTLTLRWSTPGDGPD